MHQSGIVALGSYAAGLRLLDVRDPRNIKQYGCSTGAATEVWDAYWVPQRDAKGVAVPGRKTDVVYTADAVRGVEVYEVTMPGTATSTSTSSADAAAAPAAATSAPDPGAPVQVALLPLAALPLVGWLRRRVRGA